MHLRRKDVEYEEWQESLVSRSWRHPSRCGARDRATTLITGQLRSSGLCVYVEEVETKRNLIRSEFRPDLRRWSGNGSRRELRYAPFRERERERGLEGERILCRERERERELLLLLPILFFTWERVWWR